MLYPFIALLYLFIHKYDEAAPFETRSTTWTVDWSFDDKYIAAGNDKGDLNIYEAKTWKKVKSWQSPGSTITRIEWNPKFPIIAVAAVNHGKDTIVQLYDIESDEILRRMPSVEQGRAITWRPDGQQLAIVGARGSISIRNKNGALLKTLSFRNNSSLLDIDWHPTKNLLIAVDEDIFLIDIDTDRLLATYPDGSSNKGILCCQWHPAGNFFVTGDYGHENEGAEPTYIKYWNLDGSLIKRIKQTKSECRNIRWSKDGEKLAVAADVLLLLNDRGDLISKVKLSNDNLWGISWSHNGKKILLGDQAGQVYVTDVKGNIIKTFTL